MATATGADRLRDLEDGIRLMGALGADPAEARKLLAKVRALSHRYEGGRLLVGSGVDQGKRGHELRESRNGTHYCKCPNFAFKQRPGKADGLCKHLVYALALELKIPRTEDLR